MRVSDPVLSAGAMRRCAYGLTLLQVLITLSACGSDNSDPTPMTWTLQGDPPVVVSITGGPWTLAQLAAGNPHEPSVPNQSYGYGPNFLTANAGETSPMRPYYFPFITGHGTNLQGYFDWRPKNINEAIVAAHSSDGGETWQFDQAALVLTQALPVNPQSVNPDGSLEDNGFGHPAVIRVTGPTPIPTLGAGQAGEVPPTPGSAPATRTLLYTLDRSTANVDKFGLIVNTLSPTSDMPLTGALAEIPLASEFTDESKVTRTTGLLDPDGILAVIPRTSPVEILYIQKIRNGDASGSTALPAGAQCQVQPYIPAGETSAFPANHDIVNVRIATTQDGVNFTDQGIVNGLNDPTTVSFAGTRSIAPNGTILDLGDGHYGLFFAGGNCMDADSDAFHYIGYAENTVQFDVSNWTIVNDINNPIVSTTYHTLPVNGIMTTIPAATPVVGPPLKSFDIRSYTPQVTVFDGDIVVLTFGGYHVYSEKTDLLDYRAINMVRLKASRSIPLDAVAD